MNVPTLFAIIALAALIHASFQLSVSMLTLLSGHALGAKARHSKVMNLAGGFSLGGITMTALLISAFTYGIYVFNGTYIHPIVWSIMCGIMAGTGVAIWIFYYRRQSGTVLWLPRFFAGMIYTRVKATDLVAEAFSLGLTSVLAEVVFTLAPLGIAALALTQLPHYLQFTGIITYTLIASFPLLYVTLLIGGGHSISRIQKWREHNKRFIQVIAGTALFILAAFVYANAVITPLIEARSF